MPKSSRGLRIIRGEGRHRLLVLQDPGGLNSDPRSFHRRRFKTVRVVERLLKREVGLKWY